MCAACVTLFEVDAAAVSLVLDGNSSVTLGASGPLARTYDELQFTFGEGPCRDSMAAHAQVMVTDLADAAARWPAYAPAMLAKGVRGVFAMPVLAAGQQVGALAFFCHAAGPLAPDQVIGALVAAELAVWPMLDLMSADLASNDPDGDAWAELDRLSCAEVAQATGMSIAQLDVSAATALVRLRAHAFATGRGATEVARDIVGKRLKLERT